MATNPLTDLDFDQIKTAIIDYIKNSDTTFTDYNFEGSALNSIIDILAYNTHTNAYYANMLHSESFLDTAQKRGSVVSKAKELGYTPKSVTASNAFVNINTSEYSEQNTVLYIPRGAVFNSSNDSGSYQFLAKKDYYSKPSGSIHIFENVNLVSGVYLSNMFVVDTTTNIRSLFQIPNLNVDTTTLRVYVKESLNSIEKVEYKLASDITTVDRLSDVYYLQESYTGHFEIYFGSNIIGKSPVDGNVIEIDYFSSEKPDLPNGCRFFSAGFTLSGATIESIDTTQVAFGGSYKDSLDVIKHNALNNNVFKNRAVSAMDYTTLLISKFPYIKSVNVWGGEDNVPPIFGKVFLSLQPTTGFTISDATKKSEILPVVKKYSLVTITPEFVDPIYTFLDFETNCKFYKDRTTNSAADLESSIRYNINQYVASISSFNSEYTNSQLQRKCLDIDTAISSVDINFYVSYNIVPLINVTVASSYNFFNELVDGSIKSSSFYILHNGETILVSIKQIPDSYLDQTKFISKLGAYNLNNQLILELGTVNLKLGVFNFKINVRGFANNSIRIIKMKSKN